MKTKKRVEELERRLDGLENEAKDQWKFQGELMMQRMDDAFEDVIRLAKGVLEHPEAYWFTPPGLSITKNAITKELISSGEIHHEWDARILPILPSDVGLDTWRTGAPGGTFDNYLFINHTCSSRQVLGIMGAFVHPGEPLTTNSLHFWLNGERVYILGLEELKAIPNDRMRVAWVFPPEGGVIVCAPGKHLDVYKKGATSSEYIGLIGLVAERKGVTIV